MSNADAMKKLRERVARIRTIPSQIPFIAQAAVGEVREVMAANVAAQRGPDGKSWPETEDGKSALVNAMHAVDVRAVGNTIVIAVDGVENRHHTGRVKGGKPRPIIPSRSAPEAMNIALENATTKVLSGHMDG